MRPKIDYKEQIDYKEKYEQLTKEFELFACAVSHDLNAPIRHIREFVKILLGNLNDQLTEEQKQAVHFINKGVDDSKNMIGGLISFSRICTSNDQFKLINVERVINQAILNCQNLIDDKNATINLPSQYPNNVEGNQGQLCELFSQLIKNAVVFSSNQQSPVIIIDIYKTSSNYIFAIKDNGIGIEERYFDKVFDIFKQINSDSPGIGIGLTLAQKIVSQHQGKIWIESKNNEGSIFYISLPHAELR